MIYQPCLPDFTYAENVFNLNASIIPPKQSIAKAEMMASIEKGSHDHIPSTKPKNTQKSNLCNAFAHIKPNAVG